MELNVTENHRLAWSLTEIAKGTGLSLNFLRYEVRRGHLTVTKFGRRVLVRNDELQRYIETGSKGGRALAVER